MRNKNCQVDSCDSSVKALNLCNKHYIKLRRHGSPTATIEKTKRLYCQNGHSLIEDNVYHHKAGTNRAVSVQCKTCHKEKAINYSKINKESIKKYKKQWRINNKEHCAKKNREYSHRHRIYKADVKTENYGGLDYIFSRDSGICGYCGIEVQMNTQNSNLLQATIDHIAPISKGGPDLEWNVILACRGCNNSKYNKGI